MSQPTKDFIISGKLNIVIDGALGSTGKGLIAGCIALDNHIDYAITSQSPNSGHTVVLDDDTKIITKQFPIAGVLSQQNRGTIYFNAGAVIDVPLFFKEMEMFNIDPGRVYIHPRVGLIFRQDKEQEADPNSVSKISSTMSGTGVARTKKIMRVPGAIAGQYDLLKEFVRKIDLHKELEYGCSMLCETGQGMDLGLDHGLDYPYCTSRDVLPAHILADCGVHPCFLGNVMVSVRTFPIRVGNRFNDKGEMISYSGPFPEDSEELTWEDLEVPVELTTVTKTVRRVATWSESQYNKMLSLVRPSHVFLNFVNYLTQDNYRNFIHRMPVKPTHLGFGPHVSEIYKYDDVDVDIIEGWLGKNRVSS